MQHPSDVESTLIQCFFSALCAFRVISSLGILLSNCKHFVLGLPYGLKIEYNSAISFAKYSAAAQYFIGVGRFRILVGGPRFRILGGQGGAKFPAGT